ncbi:ABC-F family ATP-binding cassette domain-containing protein [Paenibacillus sp. TRM 82003]|nr:ABC-F family ATP-binding cassette domain-containing protein [Paenibacillus sp. TRM 82003]
MAVLCAADKISKNWGGAPVLAELSLEIREKERVGLVGPNGCGKTTLLTLLAGADQPDAGAIHYKKGSKVSLLAQIPDFGPTRTTGEVLAEAFEELKSMRVRLSELEGRMADPSQAERAMKAYGPLLETFGALGGYEMEAATARVAEGLGITRLLDQPFASLSGGERTKVGLGRILLLKPDVLLLDEPTNHLDLQAVEWLEGYLQEYDGAVLIVSHDRYFLDRVATKIVDMEGGVADVYHGNYSYFLAEKERRLLAEFNAYQEQQKKLKKMEEAIRRLRQWAHEADNPKLFKRAAAMQKAMDRIEKLDRPVLERPRMALAFEMDERSGKDVVVMDGVGKRFGDNRLFERVDLHVRFRDSAAIVGGNGAGKSTLLRMVTEGLRPDEGVVRIGSGVKIGYLAQHDLFPDGERTILDAFRDVVAVEEGRARHLLAQFLFYGASVFRKVKNLSGGEKMRLRLAQLMHQDVNFLVLDEPTNHLDIDAREALEETLAAFPGTILCVSHDRYFLNKLFPVTLWMEGGRLTRYEGAYDWAKAKRAEPAAGGRSAARAETDSAVMRSASAPAREPKRTKPSPESTEREIEALERKIALLDEAMSREGDAAKLQSLYAERTLLEAERELLYERLE